LGPAGSPLGWFFGACRPGGAPKAKPACNASRDGVGRCAVGTDVPAAFIKNGHLVLDEPTSLPEGTVLDLVVVDDEGDELEAAERDALHRQLATAWESASQGKARPAEELLAELRKRPV